MSPNVINKKKDNIKIDNKYKKIKKKIQEYQKFIRSNLEYVGDNFVYKARTVHYDKKNYKKGIYGNATTKEIKELKDEGIETETIPWINDSEN